MIQIIKDRKEERAPEMVQIIQDITDEDDFSIDDK